MCIGNGPGAIYEVDAQTSQRETAIAMETKKTHWAFVEIVTPMLIQMAFVTMSTTV